MKLLITWLIVCLVSRSQGKPTKITVSLYIYNYWLSKDAHLLVHAFSDRRGIYSGTRVYLSIQVYMYPCLISTWLRNRLEYQIHTTANMGGGGVGSEGGRGGQ